MTAATHLLGIDAAGGERYRSSLREEGLCVSSSYITTTHESLYIPNDLAQHPPPESILLIEQALPIEMEDIKERQAQMALGIILVFPDSDARGG